MQMCDRPRAEPSGLIYASFDETRHKVPRIAIPDHWPRFLGPDFGGVNTAGIFFAQERDAYQRPTGRLFAYREYKAGERSAGNRPRRRRRRFIDRRRRNLELGEDGGVGQDIFQHGFDGLMNGGANGGLDRVGDGVVEIFAEAVEYAVAVDELEQTTIRLPRRNGDSVRNGEGRGRSDLVACAKRVKAAT